jgi:hypothetical protein
MQIGMFPQHIKKNITESKDVLYQVSKHHIHKARS